MIMPASGFETIYRGCDCCGQSYIAKTENLRRGWGRCCSKSCAAKIRERNKKAANYKRSTVPKSQHDVVVKQRDELLAALKKAHKWFEDGDDDWRADELAAAIAKAEG